MNKKKTIHKAKTKGEKSPAIYAKGNVSINYGKSYDTDQKNSENKRKKSVWKRILGSILIIISILAGIAGFSGYSVRDFVPNGCFDKSNEKSLPNQQVKTEGDNSPALIVNDGNATINYGETSQKKDSTTQE